MRSMVTGQSGNCMSTKQQPSKMDKAIKAIRKLNLQKVLRDEAAERIKARKRERSEKYGF